MVKVTVVFMGTNDPARMNQRIDVEEGATVRTALAKAGVPTDDVLVNVNRVKGSLDQVVGANDSITVTPTNLKGAAIDFAKILAFGKGDATVGDDVVSRALAKRAEDGSKKLETIVGGLIDVMESEAANTNRAVANAEKALKAALESRDELAYASEQLKSGNIFSLLAFAGMKGDAYRYCDQMGCAVPANNSDVWRTSEPAAPKK